MPKGSMCYLGTDGLPDQNDQKRKRLGEAALLYLMQQYHTYPPDKQAQAIISLLEHHAADTLQRDDILWLGWRC